ncbi:MAG: polyprenyl synthetase family protein [Candidatus Saccharimonadales bacterium]
MSPDDLAKLLAVPQLPACLSRLTKELISDIKAQSPILAKPAGRLIELGGKRLRSTLVFGSALVAGGKVDELVFRAAKAVELVHLASLIHNDLIDGAKRRRGSLAVQQQEGKAIALLTGDYLLALAAGQAAEHSQALAKLVSETIADMAAGQARQLDKDYQADPEDKAYLEVIQNKTAKLFETACLAGGLSVNANAADLKSLGQYGRAFGLSFQIIDDLLDKDIPKTAAPKAISRARQYSAQARRALLGFDQSPTGDGLGQLPDYYLGWALPAKML